MSFLVNVLNSEQYDEVVVKDNFENQGKKMYHFYLDKAEGEWYADKRMMQAEDEGAVKMQVEDEVTVEMLSATLRDLSTFDAKKIADDVTIFCKLS